MYRTFILVRRLLWTLVFIAFAFQMTSCTRGFAHRGVLDGPIIAPSEVRSGTLAPDDQSSRNHDLHTPRPVMTDNRVEHAA